MKSFKNFIRNKSNLIENIKSQRNLSSNILSANDFESFVFDLDSELEGIPVYTGHSDMINLIDVPEVSSVESEFVYNFFEKEERKIDNTDVKEILINENSNLTSEKDFLAKTQKIPRFVRVNFKSAKDVFLKIASSADKRILKKIKIDDIEFESASSSKFFTGMEIKDTGAEKSIYKFLKGISEASKIKTIKDSPLSAAKKIHDDINEEDEENDDESADTKRILLDIFNSNKEGQIVFAKNDVSSNSDRFSEDSVGSQNFSVKINNKYINSILRRANRYPVGIFQDEIFGALDDASEIEQQSRKLKKNQSKNRIDEVDYVRVASKYVIETNDRSNSTLIEKKETEVKLIGYLVEKTEIFNDESIKVHEPFILEDSNNMFVIDPNVRYGGRYVYKVRTLCIVRSPAVKLDADNPILDEVVIARTIMASEGITTVVSCFEKIPPPPPSGIRARFDFKRKMPVLTWQFPVNPQRDIKRFQIFKRLTVDEPYTLVAEYDFDDSVDRVQVSEIAQLSSLYRLERPKIDFTDVEFDINTNPIYAIASVDAHGMTSNLSTQIAVKYEKYKNRLVKRLVSREGAPKQYPNIYLEEDTFQDAIKVSNYDNMHVFFDPDSYKVFSNSGDNSEYDLKFLAVDPDASTYSFQILNVDLQKDSIVNVAIEDTSGNFLRSPASMQSKVNLGNKK